MCLGGARRPIPWNAPQGRLLSSQSPKAPSQGKGCSAAAGHLLCMKGSVLGVSGEKWVLEKESCCWLGSEFRWSRRRQRPRFARGEGSGYAFVQPPNPASWRATRRTQSLLPIPGLWPGSAFLDAGPEALGEGSGDSSLPLSGQSELRMQNLSQLQAKPIRGPPGVSKAG